ncbi:low molecular weight protein tyrosine phosphatase family protein [Inhella crocodyli]|uniref:low molecular weight protein tyrosine phosphatase family protein n=1 Tax=Inhella crocodyli TaxID=2499851 RepID=UPI00267C0B50
MPAEFKREKNWKHLYMRSVKLARAKQLGLEYPRVTEAQLTQEPEELPSPAPTNVLFVCSRNQWRSPTAEQVWRKHPALCVRSAGTSPNAKHPVSVADLAWAQVIFVMEEKHKSRLLAAYRRLLDNKPIHVLDIPDEYRFMDPELVELVRESVGAILGLE